MSHTSGWLRSIEQNYSGSAADKPFCTSGSADQLGVCLMLGSSIASSTGSTIAAWTASGGLIDMLSATLQLQVTWEDTEDHGDAVVDVGIQDVDVTLALSAFTQLSNTCPGGSPPSGSTCDAAGQALTLFTCVDLAQHVATGAPSPDRPGFTRRIGTKGLRGLQLALTSNSAASFSLLGVAYEAVPHIMQQMDLATNCFPGQLQGCELSAHSTTPATTYASGAFASTACQCAFAPYPKTSCTKVFAASAPANILLLLEAIPQVNFDATSGTWTPASPATTILFTKHASSLAVQVPNAAACFPYAQCSTGAGTVSSAQANTTLIIILVVACAVVLAGVAAVAYHWWRAQSAKAEVARIGVMPAGDRLL